MQVVIKCNVCGSEKVIKAGWAWRNRQKNVQKYRCKECGKIFVPVNGDKEKKSGG